MKFHDPATQTFGPAYRVAFDAKRIAKQHERILAFMRATGWNTLSEIEAATGDPQSSISAQLRHLRKPAFGSWVIDKRRRSSGTWEYHLQRPLTVQLALL